METCWDLLSRRVRHPLTALPARWGFVVDLSITALPGCVSGQGAVIWRAQRHFDVSSVSSSRILFHIKFAGIFRILILISWVETSIQDMEGMNIVLFFDPCPVLQRRCSKQSSVDDVSNSTVDCRILSSGVIYQQIILQAPICTQGCT